LIDDFSRKVWFYALKSKEDCFERFKEFKALVENPYTLSTLSITFSPP
jgi:hypothetical protein